MTHPKDKYNPPFVHRSAHLSTIFPNRFRKVSGVNFQRQCIELPDGDFVDLDISRVSGKHAMLLLHGLEGSSASQYMRAMAKLANENGIDAFAMNHRSCSGRPNRLAESYHSGRTDDPNFIIRNVIQHYAAVFVVGFSLGGNIALKMAGEWSKSAPKNVRAIVGISVPCDLASSSARLAERENFVYLHRFLSQLKRKALAKETLFPEAGLNHKLIKNARSFTEFDNAYTAPAHGFESAADYYSKSSSGGFIHAISVPTLIINAANDSFLGTECYPFDAVNRNPQVEMLLPQYGGHVGFATDTWMSNAFWHESQCIAFIKNV